MLLVIRVRQSAGAREHCSKAASGLVGSKAKKRRGKRRENMGKKGKREEKRRKKKEGKKERREKRREKTKEEKRRKRATN